MMAVEEPIEVVKARVRRKLTLMGLSLLAIPVLYGLSLAMARGKALEVADCLPPGVTLATPVADRGPTVADALAAREARVSNGVLVDGAGRAIAFERPGEAPVARDERVTVIEIGPDRGPAS
jgi:hypothetical protein